jgi:DNA end-binding protein Ku
MAIKQNTTVDKPTTAPHKVWKGMLSFGLVSFPVSLSASARENKISFNQLHGKCQSRLKQPAMNCPTCQTSVAKEEIVKGYEVSAGQFVTISKQEIESAEPKSSRILEITEFVSETHVDPVYFESSFFLAVEDGGQKAYSLIRQAMLSKGVVAIAKLFYSGKENLALVRPIAGGLMLHTLFWDYELRESVLQQLPDVTDAELSMAGQLVDALTSPTFESGKYHDKYRENLLSLIERKKAGETISTEDAATAKKPPVSDIFGALTASIQAAKSARGGVA